MVLDGSNSCALQLQLPTLNPAAVYHGAGVASVVISRAMQHTFFFIGLYVMFAGFCFLHVQLKAMQATPPDQTLLFTRAARRHACHGFSQIEFLGLEQQLGPSYP